MSAVWFTLIITIFLSSRALSDQAKGSSGVTWKTIGTSIAIACSPPMEEEDLSELESVSLKKGLKGLDADVVFLDKSGKVTINREVQTRAKQSNDQMKLTVTISNLTRADTGLYTCIYSKLSQKLTPIETEGNGSVLLVVEESRSMPCVLDSPQNPSQPSTVLLVVCALTGGCVLLISVIVLCKWGIPKVKSYCSTFTPTRVNTSDVYEDMRSTMRRRDDGPVCGQQPLSQHP